jgi:hypothetical protein
MFEVKIKQCINRTSIVNFIQQRIASVHHERRIEIDRVIDFVAIKVVVDVTIRIVADFRISILLRIFLFWFHRRMLALQFRFIFISIINYMRLLQIRCIFPLLRFCLFCPSPSGIDKPIFDFFCR